ncbi:MAG TPA: aspartate kinase [Vicinamibacteria bacterium]
MAETNPHRVLKFGGTSVGSPESLRHALAIVQEAAAARPIAVVASALSGVTDQLAALAQGVGRGLDVGRIVTALRARHAALLAEVASGPARREAETVSSAVWAGLDRHLAAIAAGGDRTASDAILAAGERLAVPIFVAALRTRGLIAEGVDGTEVIRTDDVWGEANVDVATTRTLVAGRLKELPPGVVPIVTGFVGATGDGRTTVLGRGGSDYTAAVLGAALGADRVEIWTDVDGVLSADPHLVTGAFTLEYLSYDEALVLACAGARVLHPKTIPPLAESRIPVFVGNTLRPEGVGSWVGTDRSWAENDSSSVEADSSWVAAKAVASSAINGHATIHVLPSTLAASSGLEDRVRQVLAEADLAATPGPREPRAVTVVVPTEHRARAVRAIHEALVKRAGPGPRPSRLKNAASG